MRSRHLSLRRVLQVSFFAASLGSVVGTDVLRTQGFTSCLDDSTIKVTALDVEYNRAANTVTFNVGGISSVQQDVTANLVVTAYGKEVYNSGAFDPCEAKIKELCPGKTRLM